MKSEASDRRAKLIRAVQGGVPLVRRPFAALGKLLGQSEEAVIEGLRELTAEGILREISAVLEGSVLGYDSALVVGSVPEEDLERTVGVINAHPTVSHNYQRNHAYNLWFTIAVASGMSLDLTLELLAKEAGTEAFHALRRTHTFKIGVNFDPESLRNSTAATETREQGRVVLNDTSLNLFRALQIPLPIEARPFESLAERVGVDEAELLDFSQLHLGGAIRRYVGTLRHRKLGVRENAMVVWRVPAEAVETVGRQLAGALEVSHCYARGAIEGFPYTLYSMVHGPSRESCFEIARTLSEKTGFDEYAVLFSVREFRKERLRYFLPELDDWWAARTS